MVTREYWRDRTDMPWAAVEGPWQHEPDKVQWTDEGSGLPCLAVRNQLGFWCGYVGVGPAHSLHGTDWTTAGGMMDLISGSHAITYSAGCDHGFEPDEGICHIPEPGEPDDVWWFGFACDSIFDEAPYLTWLRKQHPEIESLRERVDTLLPVYRKLTSVRIECAGIAYRLANWEQRYRSEATMSLVEVMRRLGLTDAELEDEE